MGRAVVHFEIEGRDAGRLRAFYGELCGWHAAVDPDSPAEYGLIDREANLDAAGNGIGGAISRVPDEPSPSWRGPTRAEGYPGHVTVVVEVADVEAALRRAEGLGGRRMQGPDPLFPGVEIGKLADPEGHLIGVITAARARQDQSPAGERHGHSPSVARHDGGSEPAGELDARFSSRDATARSWAEVVGVIETAAMFWLSTVRRDGRPHVTPLPAIWLDGVLHFCTGPGEQKAHNLRDNPACVLTTGTNVFGSGLDVVVEGHAVRVTDRPLLERLAERWETKLGWPFEVTDDGFRERSSEIAGEEFDDRGTAQVFAVAPAKVLAFNKGEPFSQTRFRLT